jgi:hypothetical protein
VKTSANNLDCADNTLTKNTNQINRENYHSKIYRRVPSLASQFLDFKLNCGPGERAANEGSIGWEFLIIPAIHSDSDIVGGARTPQEDKRL